MRRGKEIKKPLNAEASYNWTTLDISGDLVVGGAFGCLQNTDYHPWMVFESAEEITIAAVAKLPYMMAVLSETLRSYPPVLANLPRSVPEGGAMIAGRYVLGGVSALLPTYLYDVWF